MFERFTDRARKLLALANREAQRKNNEYIGTEHIFAGLINEGSGVGAAVLKNLGVDLNTVKKKLDKLIKIGPKTITLGKLPQTSIAKHAIECAIEEARSMGHNYIGSEHILLGLMADKGIVPQMLMDLGLNKEQIRNEIKSLLDPQNYQEDAPKNEPASQHEPAVVDICACYVCNKWHEGGCSFAETIKNMPLCNSKQFREPVNLRAKIYNMMAVHCQAYERVLDA